SPIHGEGGIDQRSVGRRQSAQLGQPVAASLQRPAGIAQALARSWHRNTQILGDAILGGNMLSGQAILFERLEQAPVGGMLLEVKEDESMEQVFKIHVQRSGASGGVFWNICQGQT
ncbi:MAG: hypothetical protein FWF31_00915, partial [Desulfobulbus sp.]|nr:hypothetical protein [Desulfobulbus sp.]